MSLFAASSVLAQQQYNPKPFINEHSDFFRVLNSEPSDVSLGYYYQPETEAKDGPGKFDLQRFYTGFELPAPILNSRFATRQPARHAIAIPSPLAPSGLLV